MKKLTCEMCGSTELIKIDGLFVCQSCGCKYTLEEAKKMMIEVGTSDRYTNIVKMARESFEDNNYEDAKRYASDALILVANNSEMIIIQGLADLGQQHNTDRVLDVPLSTVNSVRRALKSLNEVDDIVEKKMVLKKVEDNINSIVSVKIDELKKDLERIEKIDQILKFDSNKATMDLAKRQMLNALAGDTGRYDSRERELDKELHDGDIRMAHKIMCRVQIKKYEEFLAACNKDIGEKKNEIDALEICQKKKIIEKYFANNPEEYATYNQRVQELEERKKTLEKRMSEKQQEINEVEWEKDNKQTPLQKKKKALCDQIEELEQQRNKLGFFKKKEIKMINEKILSIKNLLPKDENINNEIEEFSASTRIRLNKLNREVKELDSSIKNVEKGLKNLEKEVLEAARE